MSSQRQRSPRRGASSPRQPSFPSTRPSSPRPGQTPRPPSPRPSFPQTSLPPRPSSPSVGASFGAGLVGGLVGGALGAGLVGGLPGSPYYGRTYYGRPYSPRFYSPYYGRPYSPVAAYIPTTVVTPTVVQTIPAAAIGNGTPINGRSMSEKLASLGPGQVLDVSFIDVYGHGSRIIPAVLSPKNNKRGIPGIPVVSNNSRTYVQALEEIYGPAIWTTYGPQYEQLRALYSSW